LGYWLHEQISLIQMARRGNRLTDPNWARAVEAIAGSVNLKQRVTLISSPRVTIPMAWGFWRPVVFLPVDAQKWTPQRREVVLTHELVHIKRGDTLTQWIGLLSCAVNWFNPLVWWTFRRLSVECERACDDRVLSLGTSVTEYASHLVDMARAALRLPNSIKALSRKSELSLRVRSILNPSRNHRSLSRMRGLTVMFSYVSLLTLPLSTVTPGLSLYPHTRAKPANTTLLVGIPGYMAGLLSSDIFSDFEALHPGIQVIINPVEEEITAARYTDDYYTQVEAYANAGDVLFVSPPQYGPAATLPGYFLDLTPLANVDSSMNDDFFPAALQSFQWDGKQWGLPIYWNLAAMNYDPVAFDAVGLAYPSERWTLSDLINAARVLKTDDRYGLEMIGGFNAFEFLLGSNTSWTVESGIPQFNNPELATQVEQWAAFAQTGLIGPDFSQTGSLDEAWDNAVPLQIAPLDFFTPNDERVTVPMPSGKVAVNTIGGVAISAGTQHPEDAYDLAKYLTTRPESYAIFGSSVAPARLSLFDSAANNFSVDLQPVFEELAAQAVPPSDFPYQDYLSLAVRLVIGGASAAEALNQAQDQSVADQATALARQGTFTLSIPVSILVEIPEGKTALHFGLESFIQPLPNRDRWDQVMADFAATDPDIGYVDLTITGGSVMGNRMEYAADFDCFYIPSTLADTTGLLNLDPLMDSDPAFDPDDFLPGVLDRVRQGDQTFGYPLSVQPQVLTYNVEGFQQAGVPLPANGWTTSDFVATVGAIKAATGEAALNTNFGIAEHLFILVEAFGGLPIDFRSDPPTVDFTSPQNVEAVRRVLDLVREGYISYWSSLHPENEVNPSMSPLMMTAYIDPMMGVVSTDDGWNYVSYPTGDVTPVSIGVGTAYISQQAANPEACYRWIATLSANPDLINAMPARTSGINNPQLQAAQGDSAVKVYQQIDTVMRTPGTLVSSTAFAGENIEVGYLKYWLQEAFDAYVLNDSPLEDALAEGQIKASAYLGCAAHLSPDLSPGSSAYYEAHHQCALRADPDYPY
jgi:ABC-type glycerol-3-phosphate transport system substrate-binding protein